MAVKLYDDLRRAGVDPWLDRKKLLPGQNWKRAIKQAMKTSAYIVTLLSTHSVSKQGYVQKELKEALELLEQMPPSDIFIIPVRLDACEPLDERLQELHWVDLFESYAEGVNLILQVVQPTATAQVAPLTPTPRRPLDRTAEDDLLREKLSWLRQARILETDAATLFKLDKQIEAAERERAQLEEALANADRPALPIKQTQPEPPPARKPPKQTPRSRLRSEPLTVSEIASRGVFKLDKNWRPLEYIQNEYEDQGEIVFDHATGLMWQKAGSENYKTYQDAKAYIKQLNEQKFVGYADWRLPTIPELMSLLEPEKQSNDLYINAIFDANQWWRWSADLRAKGESSSGAAWYVHFNYGVVGWGVLDYYGCIRAVRS